MKKIIFTIFIGIILATGATLNVFAYQIQDLPNTEIKGDIVVGPTKVELFLNPGDKATKEITVTNRTGKTVSFSVGIEDFTGSHDVLQPIIFLGQEQGPYSLKNFIVPEVKDFTLKHGQRIHLPVEISIPKDADPGGRYGVVFAITNPGNASSSENQAGQVAIVSRAGILFFVRINGQVQEMGQFNQIVTENKFYESGPIAFNLFFENKGSVHLSPYGTIEIKNILGKTVGQVELDPWFVMPDSLRARQVSWDSRLLFGKYTAIASVNRGYQDIIDQKKISFWVIPWKIVLVVIAVLFLIIWFFRWLFSKFEFKRKT
jgi:hypothetical protein